VGQVRLKPTRLRRWAAILGVFVALYVSLSCISVRVGIPQRGGVGLLLGSVLLQLGEMELIPSRSNYFDVHPPQAEFGWRPYVVRFPGTTVVLVPLWMPLLLGLPQSRFGTSCAVPLCGLARTSCHVVTGVGTLHLAYLGPAVPSAERNSFLASKRRLGTNHAERRPSGAGLCVAIVHTQDRNVVTRIAVYSLWCATGIALAICTASPFVSGGCRGRGVGGFLGSGLVWLEWGYPRAVDPPDTTGVDVTVHAWEWELKFVPEVLHAPGATYIVIPAWLLLIPPLAAATLAQMLRRRLNHPARTAPGCAVCGYCLTGNVSGVCPECASATRRASVGDDVADLVGRCCV